MQLAGKLSDVQAQRKALTAMLQSGGAPSSDLPYLRYLAGYFSYVLNDMNDAIAQLTYARQLGYAGPQVTRSEEHTSELQSLMRISYAVFCLKKKKKNE